VTAGTLRIGDGGTSGSLAGNIANSGTVTFDRSDASEFAGVISGTGGVRQAGLGTTILSATNSYTGGTTVAGGTLTVAAAPNLGGGSTAIALETGGTLATAASFSTGRGIAVAGGTLDVASGTTLTVNSGGLSGSGTLTKTGTGELSLTSASGLTGSIIVAAGTLRSASQLQGVAAITVNPGGTLQVAVTNTFTAGHGAAENMLVTVDGGLWTNTGGVVNRIGDVTLANGAIWTLTGLSNDWGTYFLGPVVGGDQARVTVTGSSASTIDGDGNFKLGSRVVFDVADVTGSDAADLSIAPALQNGTTPDFTPGGIEKTGPGTLLLTGNNVYTNGTVVSGGVLSVASITDAGGVGSIGAVGSGTGFLALSGGGILRYTGTGAEATSRNLFNDLGNGGIEVAEAAGSITFTGLTSGGATANLRSFTKSGPGAVALAGTNTFTNAITLEAGTLRVGAGGTAGAISGNVANSGTLVFDRSDALTYGGLISGEGGVVKESAGTLTLSNTGNSFSGNLTIAGGTISAVNAVNSASANSVLGAKTSARSIIAANGGRLAIGINDLFGGGGMTAANIPTLVIEAGGEVASTRYAPIGNVTLTGGTLTQSSVDSGSYEGLEFLGTITVAGSTPSTITTGNGRAYHLRGNATTIFDVADVTGDELADLVVSAPLRNGSGNYSGNGGLRKTGAGTMTLSAASTYSGGTTVAGGTLRATNAAALGQGNVTVDAGARLFVDAALTLQGANAVSIAQGGFLDLADGASVPFGPGGSIRGLAVAPGPDGNRAAVLAGTSRGGRVSAEWMGRPGGGGFVSDVLDFSTGNGAGPIQPFVLSLTYDNLIPPADEANAFLFWNSTPGGAATWVNAVVGNAANNASLDQQGYLGSFSQFQSTYGTTLTDYMGAFGRDETTSSVWAVMNHNSEFVVFAVPEPGTLALVAAALVAGLAFRRRASRG
jgi:fibronectin-binding autotransporter adhesin